MKRQNPTFKPSCLQAAKKRKEKITDLPIRDEVEFLRIVFLKMNRNRNWRIGDCRNNGSNC